MDDRVGRAAATSARVVYLNSDDEELDEAIRRHPAGKRRKPRQSGRRKLLRLVVDRR